MCRWTSALAGSNQTRYLFKKNNVRVGNIRSTPVKVRRYVVATKHRPTAAAPSPSPVSPGLRPHADSGRGPALPASACGGGTSSPALDRRATHVLFSLSGSLTSRPTRHIEQVIAIWIFAFNSNIVFCLPIIAKMYLFNVRSIFKSCTLIS